MTTSSFSPISFINSLAEITRHEDHQIIVRSLLEALNELTQHSQYWLYQVVSTQPEPILGLIAHSSGETVTTSHHPERQQPPSNELEQAILTAIATNTIQSTAPIDESDTPQHTIYPAENARHEVFAVLVELSHRHSPTQRAMTHGFLRVYANYLRLLQQSRRDKLTGLLNRETLENEIIRILILNQQQSPVAATENPPSDSEQREPSASTAHWLGVLDVDHFKQINDNYGHLYGDEILILIARFIERSIRDYDLAFRFGGEEFVILLKAEKPENARLAFERIRQAINQHHYAKVNTVTVSIGVTQIASQIGPSDAIAEADAALYYAKQNGRDQVQFHNELISSKLIETSKEIETGGVNFF